MHKIKKDKYQRARGGHSKIYEVACEHCKNKILTYQKDGDGVLKRMYRDRIVSWSQEDSLSCNKCNRTFGINIIYQKENRPAIRLFVGSIKKHLIYKA